MATAASGTKFHLSAIDLLIHFTFIYSLLLCSILLFLDNTLPLLFLDTCMLLSLTLHRITVAAPSVHLRPLDRLFTPDSRPRSSTLELQ